MFNFSFLDYLKFMPSPQLFDLILTLPYVYPKGYLNNKTP